MPPVRDPVPSTVADLAALGQLWEQHRERLFAMIDRRIDPKMRQRFDADTVLQEAFIDASRFWADYQRGSPMQPYAWLYGITFERYIEIYRRHTAGIRDARRENQWPDDCSAVLGAQLMDSGTGPLTAAQRAEMTARVHQVLGLLPDADQDLLTMRYFDQLTTREICDVLNAREPKSSANENALNVRLFRLLKKLQKIWQSTYADSASAL